MAVTTAACVIFHEHIAHCWNGQAAAVCGSLDELRGTSGRLSDVFWLRIQWRYIGPRDAGRTDGSVGDRKTTGDVRRRRQGRLQALFGPAANNVDMTYDLPPNLCSRRTCASQASRINATAMTGKAKTAQQQVLSDGSRQGLFCESQITLHDISFTILTLSVRYLKTLLHGHFSFEGISSSVHLHHGHGP